MATFFRLMQGDSNDQSNYNEYFMTHPLYTNRISNIKNKGGLKLIQLFIVQNDYLFIKNILESSSNIDLSENNINSDSTVWNHKACIE